MLIRQARRGEAGALTALSMRAKQSNGYDDAFMAACRDELTVTDARMAGGTYWVAETGGEICGCVCLGVEDSGTAGEITAFFVDPPAQGKGIGRLLWNAVLSQAEGLGLTRLDLDSDPAAVPFYRRLGFAETGSAPSGSIPGRVLPKMTRFLAAGGKAPGED